MVYSMNLMFVSVLMLSTILIISSPSWFCMWIGLEMNMMAFIPIMYNHNNSLPSESSLKYFLIQTFASMMMLTSIILMMNYSSIDMSVKIMSLSMGIKLGAAPFHMWFPIVSEGLTWNQNFLLMTWQKIGPLVVLTSIQYNMINMIMVLSSLSIGPLMALNQTSLRKIMAYSSITHMSWMIAPTNTSSHSWALYLMIYFTTTLFIMISLHMMNIYQTTQINMVHSTTMKMSLFINILSMGGFPPLIGFIGKWVILNELTQNDMILLAIMLILSSWMNLYIYIRIMHQSIHIYSSTTKFQIQPNPTSMNFITMSISMFMLMTMMTI